MREYIKILQSAGNSPKIIWSSTTPITVKGKPRQLDPVNNPTIVKRNAIAARVMKDNDIPVNDLYALSIANLNLKRPDKYHWSKQGSALQGKEIVKKIIQSLPPSPASVPDSLRQNRAKKPVAENKIETIHIWPGKVPGETEAKAPAVAKTTSGVVTRLSNVLDPLIEVYPAPKEKRTGTGIIICPGGGYQILAIDKEGYKIAEWLNTLGITAFVLQYRVPKKQKGALQDVQRAMRIVRQRAKEWAVDPNKLGVMGFSAGGSLSARASTLYNSKTYDAVDAADKISCKPAFALLIYPAYLDNGPGKTLTPELKINKSTPPMFIFVAEDDRYAHSSHTIADALKKAQVPVEFHTVPKGGHGFGLRPGNKAAKTWPPLAAKWLNTI
jgi:acetyl esterase/lipase